MVNGYNIAFKIDGKTIVGRTQDDLTIAANVKESLTKDDAGATQYSVMGQEVTFKAASLVDVSGGDASTVDRNYLIALALKTGSEAEVDVSYEATNGAHYLGTAIITNYSESSNASDEATLSIDFKVTGTFAKIT
jgi:hypothetical protein